MFIFCAFKKEMHSSQESLHNDEERENVKESNQRGRKKKKDRETDEER